MKKKSLFLGGALMFAMTFSTTVFTSCQEVRLLPNHPVEGERLRFTISLDGSATEAVSYETKGRSEEWKENVLCNQAVRRMVLPVARKASHRLIFTALDEGVVLDQICLYMPRIK